ncbi:efflux RND transporter permease subunit [Thermosulfurimonas sp. F29]|uniref:efflux RND transporter permease subunit n=1 Tax=Thermosulfurimonas sp. F29 TaxID=2867247 RepID=UPI001C83B337|nr:efflux RND transporter permease subunit [Thermosulfurimonas sp. F29]MBX6422377.1 efflux RND transporter permease subunit [Thermosulfurimonas sp. F29]
METRGFIARIVNYFVDSKLTPLVVMLMLALGVFAVINTPSEEEPQIVVPMIDIFVEMPGATAKEIEQRVINPMEKLLWEIPGVEYVYSTAYNGRALTVVRYYVGRDPEKSLVKTYAKLYQHLDWIPPGCSRPLLKPHDINDVPIVTLTFWGKGYDAFRLRQIVARVDDEIRNIPGISETFIKGGLRREVRIELDPERIYALGLDPVDIARTIYAQNRARMVGRYRRDSYTFEVRLANFFSDLRDLENTVVGVVAGRAIYLRDVARIVDGPAEPDSYVFMVPGPAAEKKGISGEPGALYPAVTLAIAKRKGWNATRLAKKILRKVELLKGDLIPEDVQVTVTRNYGETAKDKTDTLLEHLLIATVSVAALIALFLGVRASLVVLVAIPTVLAVTLLVYYLYGYTLNRVTLFALIFCIGILVDDPIVDVENIVRHLHLPENRGKSFRDVIVGAVVEVQAPLILATLTVIAAIAPMGFVRGLMGPYMRPMPVGASVAMLLSMAVAFVITPWAAYHLLPKDIKHEEKETLITRVYRWFMGHLIRSVVWRWAFLFTVGVLFLLACSLFYFKKVYVKMLPFDNKNEFQIIVNMPEGSSLEETARAVEEMARALMAEPLITDMQLYIGTAAPFNFNGLIRHYYLRRGDHVADIQVNLVDKHHRRLQSHDIAKRVRPLVTAVARKYGARVTVAEVPPGPPVLQSLVAEVYGPDYEKQIELARKIKEIFARTPGVVDVDWYMTEPQTEWRLVVDRRKAALSGVDPARVMEVMETALRGKVLGLFHDPSAREDVYIRLRFPEAERSSLPDLSDLKVKSIFGRLVPLSEIARWEKSVVPHPIYHKNLHPVVYVVGDMAGKEEAPIYGILKINKALKELRAPDGSPLRIYYTHLPFSAREWAVKWDGEWQVTYEVFRDLGLAFAACLVLIYFLVVAWFRSYTVPILILAPIPLSLIGIIPAHALMGAFFTATSMIGFIAGAGIVVRNSIILADFIELRLRQGYELEDAVIDAGAVRFRPMLLTAAAVVVGSFVILFDPIFNGLALSLMAGEVASTLFSRMVVPILYYLDHRIKKERRLVL